jgi:hypothetical protein
LVLVEVWRNGKEGRCSGDIPDEEAAVSTDFVEPDCEVVSVDVAESEGVAGTRVPHWETDGGPGGENIVSVSVLGRFQSE